MTGAGGGALMTPMLILLFGVKPSTAISSDLVAAVLMRPVGAAVHLRRGTVNPKLVGAMVAGSGPLAFPAAHLPPFVGGSGAAGKPREPPPRTPLLAGAPPLMPGF